MSKARHRRRVPPWRLRAAYRELAAEYARLSRAYRELQTDHGSLLEDTVETALPGRYVTPAWAETQEIPVITSVPPLDPDKATALMHNSGLLHRPGFGDG